MTAAATWDSRDSQELDTPKPDQEKSCRVRRVCRGSNAQSPTTRIPATRIKRPATSLVESRQSTEHSARPSSMVLLAASAGKGAADSVVVRPLPATVRDRPSKLGSNTHALLVERTTRTHRRLRWNRETSAECHPQPHQRSTQVACVAPGLVAWMEAVRHRD